MSRLTDSILAALTGAAVGAGGATVVDNGGGNGFDSLAFCNGAAVVSRRADEHIGGDRYMLQMVKDGVVYQLDWADAPKGENLVASLTWPGDGKTVAITPEGAACIYARSQ